MIYDFKNKTIFIIDDEVEIIEIFKDIIKNHLEVNIKIFNSPLKALEELNKGNIPNLFLVDIKMPKMTGIEFISKIRSMNIKKPVIIISGHAEKEEAVESLKLGVFHLLDKPISFEILIHTLLQALTSEEISLCHEKMNKEKEYLIELLQAFTSKNEERISDMENLVLEKTNLIQNDKSILKNFLGRIYECNKIDREMSYVYKEIKNLLSKQSEMIEKNISQSFIEKHAKKSKKLTAK